MKFNKFAALALLALAPATKGMFSLGERETKEPNVKYFTNQTQNPVWVYLWLVSGTGKYTTWKGEEIKMQEQGYVAPGQRVGIQLSFSNPNEIVLLRQGASLPADRDTFREQTLKTGAYDHKTIFYQKDLLPTFIGNKEFYIYDGPDGGLFFQAGIKPTKTDVWTPAPSPTEPTGSASGATTP